MKSSEDITIDLIQKKVANVYSISFSDMKSKKRAKNIALPRQIAMYIARNHTTYSLKTIGRYFGGRDHSTVIHSIKKITQTMGQDSLLKFRVDEIVKKLQSE